MEVEPLGRLDSRRRQEVLLRSRRRGVPVPIPSGTLDRMCKQTGTDQVGLETRVGSQLVVVLGKDLPA